MLLELRDIAKSFPGVRALEGAQLALSPGTVHAVMGENGAGKSTLMKIAAGLVRPDRGEIRRDGRPVRFQNPAEARAAGIQTVFQELTVLGNLTVGQNLMIGREPARAGGAWLSHRQLRAAAQAILDRFGIPLHPDTPAGQLSTGQRQMIEIARACAQDPRVLILDEPTSSLGRAEEQMLFDLVARLRSGGVGIVYITHRMAEVFALADEITVLRDGRHVLTAPAATLDRAGVIRAMVGRDVGPPQRAAAEAARPLALSVRGMARGRLVRDASLDLHQGEVLGLAGLMGAGRTELARLVAGIDRPERGTMQLFGQPFRPGGVAAAIGKGVVYLSEDRKGLGVVLPLSVADNIALPNLAGLARRGLVTPGAIGALAQDWIARLAVKAASPAVAVETLSGGNQQKVALAKWLAAAPRVILLDEPTRGVDVGAKAEIHTLVRKLAADGAAVLVISSELPELLQVADRIAVMARGRITGILPAATATEESLLDLAFADGAEAPA